MPAGDSAPVSFERDILPLLEQRCNECHHPDEARGGLELARRHHPGVIVLDLESESADDASVCSGYDTESSTGGSSLVVLGTIPGSNGPPTSGRVVSKPYHFAPLIRTIVELLDVEPAAEQVETGG